MLHLVTGASGFIGGHLVEELISQGERVRCLVRRTSNLRAIESSNVEIVYGDITDDSDLTPFLKGVDVVHHLAALIKAPNEKTYQTTNVVAAEKLYRAFSEIAPSHARFVFCSSLAAVGPSGTGVPHTEKDSLRPITAYGRSKRDAEERLQGINGVPLTIIRPPAVYGPRDQALFPLFKLAAMGIFVRLGGVNQTLSLVHARDVARIHYEAAISPKGVGPFFVTDGPPHNWAEIQQTFSKASGKTLHVFSVPPMLIRASTTATEFVAGLFGRLPHFNREQARQILAPHWVCSSELATKAFSFSPRHSFSSGISETFRWYKDQQWI